MAATSAGAAVIRSGAIPSILVVDASGGEKLARLRAAGAWLLLDPQSIGGCWHEGSL